jgi:AcrR family transcriptional regulator
MSGKPGRPPEDRLKRQSEIFLAVTPLIERYGARRLTMRQAARAAHLSVGGLYHYFPTKRDLVLHALKPEAVARVCAEFHGRHADLERTDPRRYVRAAVADGLDRTDLADRRMSLSPRRR